MLKQYVLRTFRPLRLRSVPFCRSTNDVFACVLQADAARAASFLERACEGGDAEGCYDLGVAYEKGTGVKADRRRAAELSKKACQLGFERACPRKRR